MRLTWIRDNWEPEWIADAEAKIRTTVRQFVNIIVMGTIDILYYGC